jgi:hypothetical protein
MSELELAAVEPEDTAVETEEDDSFSSALADAWDKSEEDAPEAEEVLVAEPAADAERASSTPAAETATNPESVAQEAADKPPVGLSPEAREVWKDTPQAMKDAMAKREQDFARGIQKYAEEAKRGGGELSKVTSQHQQYMAMNGGQEKAIGDLLQAGSSLQMGSPQQKAQVVAGLIQQFGVDIHALDSMLVGGQVSPEMQQQEQMQSHVNQAVAPYKQMLDEIRSQQHNTQQQKTNEIQQDIVNFAQQPENEFFNDVREDMADIIDMASKRGQELPLGEAYKRACMMNNQISQIQLARQSQAQVAQKRQAAVSITGNHGGGNMGGGEPGSIHEALSAAWDNGGRI